MGAQNVQGVSVGVRKRWFVPYCLIVGGINGLALVFGRRQISVPALPFSKFTRLQSSSEITALVFEKCQMVDPGQ